MNGFKMNEKQPDLLAGLILGVIVGGITCGLVFANAGFKKAATQKDKEIFEDHVKNYGCVVKVEDSKIVCVEESGRKFILPQ